jgi:hypothetical protein
MLLSLTHILAFALQVHDITNIQALYVIAEVLTLQNFIIPLLGYSYIYLAQTNNNVYLEKNGLKTY